MKTTIALIAIALAACTNGQGAVDVSSSRVATFPGVSADAARQFPDGELTTNAAITLDLAKDISSLGSLGTLTATVSKDAVSGQDLGYVHHIKATILALDGTLPPVLYSDVEVPRDSTEVALPSQISNAKFLEYLAEGKVSIEFELTGQLPVQPLILRHTLIAHLDVAMQGSLKL